MVIDSTVSRFLTAIAYVTPSNKGKHILLASRKPLSGITLSCLLYVFLNLLLQAIPSRMGMKVLRFGPSRVTNLFQPIDGVVSMKEVRDAVRMISARLLDAVCASYFGWMFLRFKKSPTFYTPREDEGIINRFWCGLSEHSGDCVLLNYFLNIVAFALVASRWFMLFGVDPRAVFAFGTAGTVALSFASQKLVANTFAGLLIYSTSPFSVGDFIQTDQVIGTVEKIGWTYTTIRANNGLVVNLPNTSLSESLTKNWDKTEQLQILVEVPVRFPSYSYFTERGQEFLDALQEDLSKTELRCSRFVKPVKAYFTKYSRTLEPASPTEGPVPWILIDAWFAYDFDEDPQLHGVKSDLMVAAWASIKRQGCQVPGLEKDAGGLLGP